MPRMKQYTAWEKGRWNLRCIGVFDETHNVKSFHFECEDDANKETLFLHKPGQFITLRLQVNGQSISRSYTIASPPSRPMTLALTIKRDPKGLVSRFMHDRLTVGDVISVMGPAGTFNSADIDLKPKLLMLSGGSGITPLMSMLRHLYDTADMAHDLRFLHAARTPGDIIFGNELHWMAQERANITIDYICEREAEPGMESGYLTADRLNAMVPDFLERTILTCGPAPYMAAVKTILEQAGFDFSHYHEESFGDPALRTNPDGATPDAVSLIPLVGGPVSAAEAPQAEIGKPTFTAVGDTAGNVVMFQKSGLREAYVEGESVLEIATRAGVAIPTNCQMGLCGTCKVIRVDGDIAMDEEEGLSDEDRAEGYVLTCCGRPSGALTVNL